MRIGLTLYPGCLPSGLFAFADLLHMANLRANNRIFELMWVAQEVAPVTLEATAGGSCLSITPDCLLSDSCLDALLLPGLWATSPEDLISNLQTKQALVKALQKLPSKVAIYSYCSSVCLSAATGRLSGLQATSTWWIADYLSHAYSDVDWVFNRACIDSGNNISAAGLNGYLPIAMALIEQHCGLAVARELTKLMLLPRPDAEQMPFHSVDPLILTDQLMRDIVSWVEATAAADNNLTSLARRLNLSERTLSRRIKTATGLASKSFIRLAKFNQASELLILTSLTVNAVSNKLGYVDESTFRRGFKVITGHTPSSYRQRYSRAKT